MNQVAENPLITVRDLVVGFGPKTVLNGLSFDLNEREILGLIGPSGSGKSVALRAMTGLLPRRGGQISIFGQDDTQLSQNERSQTDRQLGVLFQQGALFSALTVLENVEFPMREHLALSPRLRRELARVKLDLVGLPASAAANYPSELSGGMIKRAALARALALDPKILFLDEPTAGLDPLGAAAFDELIVALRDTLGLTVLMVTHDLDSLAAACDRIIALGDGKVLMSGTLTQMRDADDPWLKQYFHGPRAARLGA